MVFGFIETLVTEGWGGLWAQIMESVSNVYDMVFEGIATFVRDRIIISAITKLASLFSPVGAVVQLVLTAWNIYTFLRDQLARIAEVVQTVTNAIGDIARGVLDNAKTAVEGVLARLLPLAIDLLARVIGLGNVGAKVREIVEKVRAVVDKGIDALLQRIANAFKGGGAAKGAAAGSAGAGGVDAAASPGASETESGLPGAETISETFTVGDEGHTVRGVVVGGTGTLEMASGVFGPLAAEMTRMVNTTRAIYADPGGAKYVGATEATTLNAKLDALGAEVTAISSDVAAAKAPPGATDAVQATADAAIARRLRTGFAQLRKLATALNLPALAALPVPSAHATLSGGIVGGRATWFQASPLSVDSLGRGAGASGAVPGVRLLDEYHRGHLVAASLGGPGTSENLVPMSDKANTKGMGMQGVEDSMRRTLAALRDNAGDYPPSNPPYIFHYRVTAQDYGNQASFGADLASHGFHPADGGAALFDLGMQATDATPSDSALRTAAAPMPAGMTPRQDEHLPKNLRRRLAYHVDPRNIKVEVEVLQKPSYATLKYHPGGTVATHLEKDLQWLE